MTDVSGLFYQLSVGQAALRLRLRGLGDVLAEQHSLRSFPAQLFLSGEPGPGRPTSRLGKGCVNVTGFTS